ncbi:hypothetical protein AQUCO_00600260v1, partial [Aquilegia coerulea]
TYYFSYGFYAGGIVDVIKIATGRHTFASSLAGFGTGAFCKLRQGPKAAAVAAAIGGLAAAGIVAYNNPKIIKI